MKTYEFTVILSDVDIVTDAMADALFEAGCSDGSPFSGEGIVAVGFDREAASLEAAIKSAIADIERAGQRVARVEIGSKEIAAL